MWLKSISVRQPKCLLGLKGASEIDCLSQAWSHTFDRCWESTHAHHGKMCEVSFGSCSFCSLKKYNASMFPSGARQRLLPERSRFPTATGWYQPCGWESQVGRWADGGVNRHKAKHKAKHLLLKEEAERQRDIKTRVHTPREGTEGRG